jgi:hypothetical protein
MNAKIEASLKETIEMHLGPYLTRCCWYEIFVDGDKLELLVKETEDSLSEAVIIRLAVAENFREIHISNILMLGFMKRQGIGKGLIAKIYEVAKSFNYSLFLVLMTESFFNRMVKRGAAVIEEGGCVQITDQTNLNPHTRTVIMPQQPNFYITDAQYQQLVPTGSWHINEIPLSIAQQVRGHFNIDSSFALFTSGAKADPTMVRPEDSVLAGLDWIRHETNPRPGEPPLNVYHYFVGSGSSGKYPVYDCGHSGSLAPGWSTLQDIMIYLPISGSI